MGDLIFKHVQCVSTGNPGLLQKDVQQATTAKIN